MTWPDVVILAGGFGTRLQQVVSEVPKPMAPVANKPFLHYVLSFLNEQGAKRVILATGYKHEQIEAYFGDKFLNMDILYSIENEPLGTGGALKMACKIAQTEEVLVYNGDTYFDAPALALVDYRRSMNTPAAIFLKEIEHPDRYGTVELKDGIITAFREKKTGLENGWINTGVYCMETQLLVNYPDAKFSLESSIWEPLAAKHQIAGLCSDAYFIDIGIPEDYQKANETFTSLKY